MKRSVRVRLVCMIGVLVWGGASVVWAWPGAPGTDPLLDPPNDPGFLRTDDMGQVLDGEWNLWSFTPEIWADNPNFRQEEVALGTGIWADKAWQWTPGDPQVVIAVLDSGVRWGNADLVNQFYLNRAELDGDGKRPRVPEGFDGDPMDVNGDGVFNVKDYTHFFPEEELARLDQNGNGLVDPQDLIRLYSDQVDDDQNGYVDDISGWDFFWDDNDPHDDVNFGHGDGEARDSAAEGNNGIGTIGVCPGCSLLMVRAGDSFVTDVNDFGDGVVFAVDSGASLIQEALGTINNTPFSQQAIEYAYHNNVAVVASAADELSFHHNFPGTNNHTLYVHAVVHDAPREVATTFLNYNNCTNHGMQLLLSTPGGGCSSEATGVTSGHVGLLYSAARQRALSPPLSAEEVRGLLVMSADDINVAESRDSQRAGLPCTQADQEEVCGTDGLFRCFLPPSNREDPGAAPIGECVNTKFPSGEGWDFHFGYGRNNAARSVQMVVEGMIPPEVDVVTPLWFETANPALSPLLEITGRIGARTDGQPPRYASYDYVVEYALGTVPQPEDWIEITRGTTQGMDGTLASLDLGTLPESFDYQNPPTDPHEDAVTLRVRVSAQAEGGTVSSEFRKGFFIHQDNSLAPGFPLYLGSSGESSPKAFDLDSDGKDEIVVATSDGRLHAFNEDGSQVEGFPVWLGLRHGHDPEAQGSHLGSCAYRADKAGCRAQRYQVNGAVHQSPMGTAALGDLEGDGDVEVVVSTLDGQVFAFHHDGSPVAGFPVGSDWERSAAARDPDIAVASQNTLDHGFFASPVLYDLDGDQDLEIIQSGLDQHLYVWHHDGSPKEGFPVLCRDVEDGNRGFRIIVTPAVGDLDLDGEPEMVLGTNEYYNQSESRIYIVKAEGNLAPGGPFELGGPILNFGLIGEVLPFVGEGIPSNPAIADVDFDGHPEFAIESIAGLPTMYRLDPEASPNGLITVSRADNITYGPGSNSLDSPAYPLINNGSFGRLDPSGDLAYVKGTAGFNFAFAFAEGGTRLVFDHHVSAWNTNPAQQQGGAQPFIEGFPQVVEDWQFFMNPTLADLTGDGLSEVLLGTGGYLVRAIDYQGQEAPGFPKFTGGWIISSPTVGDFDGDGRVEVTTLTRNGNLYLWDTEAALGRVDWQGFGHDPANTNNYHTPLPRQAPPVCGDGAREGDEQCDGDDLGGATCDSQGLPQGELACKGDCTLDSSGCTGEGNNGDANNNGAEPDMGQADMGEEPGGASVKGSGGCCAVSPARPSGHGPLLALLLGAALLWWRRR